MRKRVSVMQLPFLKRRRIGGIGGRQRLVPARNARVAATWRCLLCLTRRRHGQAKSSKAVNAGCLHEHTCLRRESLLNCPPQGRHVTSTLQCPGVTVSVWVKNREHSQKYSTLIYRSEELQPTSSWAAIHEE